MQPRKFAFAEKTDSLAHLSVAQTPMLSLLVYNLLLLERLVQSNFFLLSVFDFENEEDTVIVSGTGESFYRPSLTATCEVIYQLEGGDDLYSVNSETGEVSFHGSPQETGELV